MDPVSALSLAAGALSVLDVGFRALSTCREIYQKGCLAEHRDTQDITEQLLETTKQLENSVGSVSIAGARRSGDVIEVSKKCSKTATKLLSELRKLQQDPKGGFRQVIGRSMRTMRKKQYLTEIQKKLERERDILNTRILTQLDHHAVLQLQHLGEVDQNVRDLAVALSQGRNTFQQILAEQTMLVQTHVDRRFEDKANEEEVLRSQQKFKDSLFFPEMFARQENISWSHEGTCKWIFGTPCGADEILSDSEDSIENSDLGDQCDYAHEREAQPWSSFKDWLEEDSNDPYWLSGKPGLGKSTLMKYISTEFGKFCHARTSLFLWRDAVTCFFFFWNLGSPLQKNYAGFLRSLLFQIAEQRAEMILILWDDSNCRNSRPHDATVLYAWTEQRLEDALKRFLADKPPSIRICMFIDGLDEFVGDEDRLIEIIRLLSQTAGTKVCISSRPEQIFRQGFAAFPNLRLQDLNYHDIRTAVSARLTPALRSYSTGSKWEINNLVERVIHNSHGVFLWAELMTKDLKAGARNSDSIAELRDRLERTPETIDRLYEHMLKRLDKAYLGDAARYFSHLFAHQEMFSLNLLPPTLLELACSEQNSWFHPTRLGSALLMPPNVDETCQHLEIRILTRCTGLVDFKERPMDPIDIVRRQMTAGAGRSLDIHDCNDYVQGLREVELFIKLLWIFFSKNHRGLFDVLDLQWTGRLAAVRGQIIIASLAPDISIKREPAQYPIALNLHFIIDLIEASRLSGPCSQGMRDAALQTVENLYDLLRYLNASFHGPSTTMSQTYDDLFLDEWKPSYTPEHSPVYDCLKFASFFGRDDYVARFMAENHPSQADFERVIFCAVLGIWQWSVEFHYFKNLEGFLVILRDSMKRADNLNMDLKYATNKNGNEILLLPGFLYSTLTRAGFMDDLQEVLSSEPTSDLAKLLIDVVQLFLDNDADPNVMLEFDDQFVDQFFDGNSELFDESICIRFAETPLALIERLARRRVLEHPFSAEDIAILLRSHGGIKRRALLSLHDEPGTESLLTENQSNRIMSVLSLKCFRGGGNLIGGSSMLTTSMPSQPDPRAEELVTLIIDEARYREENPHWRRQRYSYNDTEFTSQSHDESCLNEDNECSPQSNNEELSDAAASSHGGTIHDEPDIR